ncbi:Lar family restriction alleviation protein [Aureimonas glaciei]|uniref:Lar family restriction alleviation protein n=1 Tax=Aureimonas glaciei TaxID=1776957 RepID=UPI003570D5A8
MANKPDALLPCPYCGGEPCRRGRKSWPKTHWVQCRSCRARGPDGLLVADDADRGWNSRALVRLDKDG